MILWIFTNPFFFIVWIIVVGTLLNDAFTTDALYDAFYSSNSKSNDDEKSYIIMKKYIIWSFVILFFILMCINYQIIIKIDKLLFKAF
jgi:hypothetical protein